MKTIVVLGVDLALASTITGIMDVFNMSGVTWNRFNHKPRDHHFDVRVVSVDGKPINCMGDVHIKMHGSINDITHADLILVPTLAGNPEKTMELNQAAIPWLKHHYDQGADIAGLSTGAYFLAEAGILNNKLATTHWGFAEPFKVRYPQVKLTPEQLITADGNVFCAGGTVACLDLCLFFLERYFGNEYASETASSAVVDAVRNSPLAYDLARSKKYHQDEDVLAIQAWLEEHYSESINLENLSDQFNMSTRTFKRRFKLATGETPLAYLQSLRIEGAKKKLELGSESIEKISVEIGYEDMAFFSKLFKRLTGLSPTQYRKKFIRK